MDDFNVEAMRWMIEGEFERRTGLDSVRRLHERVVGLLREELRCLDVEFQIFGWLAS